MKKHISILLVLISSASALRAQMPPNVSPAQRRHLAQDQPMPLQPPGAPPPGATPGEPAAPAQHEEMIPPGLIDFQGVDVSQVLEVYAQLVGRTLLRAGLPNAQIILKTETPLTRTEAIEALQAVLALNGIAIINVGDKFVKVMPNEQAGGAAQTFNDTATGELAELGSYMTRIVQLKYVKPSDMAPIIAPFQSLQNAIITIDSNGILVLRDKVENVKRMLEMIQRVDVTVPAEYISQVIPIKYAMANDIANVLTSLTGAGGGTFAFGSATTPGASRISNGTVGNPGTMGNGFQNNGTGQQPFAPFGQTSANQNNNNAAGASPFAQRLSSILNRTQQGGGGGGGPAGQQPIQILGQTKIIADERSNSLLVWATRQDMDTITNIISKLDILLAQVLIDSVIIDVDLNKAWNYGVSVSQNQMSGLGGSPSSTTAGAINNGQSFLANLSQISSNIWPANFTTTPASSGLTYLGDIGPNWDIALQAAANDSSTEVIQRPRIQTSQAKEAQFFVGTSVPYVTSYYYSGGYNGGPSANYSQLQVGISLDVTPFINPDGLVVMDINQQINDISGYTDITGVGNVPTTDNRTLTSEIAVKDRDTIILGGFIRNEHDKGRTGVPILEDIPILGALFSSRTSSKQREELVVLMRPTVLRTPEIASAQTLKEKRSLPGVEAAERDDLLDERKAEAAEHKAEAAQFKKDGSSALPPESPFFNTNEPPNP